MGSSYVEYKRFGFWARDNSPGCWLTAMLDEMGKVRKRQPWQETLRNHWQIQAVVDGGCISVGLDDFVIDDAREKFLLSVAKGALEHCKPLGHRTGQLFI